MSRQDLQDLEYPPALRSHRSDGQQLGGYPRYAPSINPHTSHDRRGLSASTAYPPSAPRSQYDEYTIGPNRNNASNAQMAALNTFSSFNQNHNHFRPSSSPSSAISSHPSPTAIYRTPPSDGDHFSRHAHAQQPQQHPPAQPTPLLPASTSNTSRSTLWWCDLEPWMDEEYARQVCSIMGWDPVNIKVPHPPSDTTPGQPGANNPGYCFLTFPSHGHAAAVLAQINAAGKGSLAMPNSSRPFVLNWASSLPATAGSPGFTSPPISAHQPYQKEYSIFVGDLAPETSNSDLVAVFRNPVLGLRNDREPKFIRPFVSCKSAKIMLDPVTGVSRGYGFVRFTDEADQQRALIEMHGLYCLSRPMRISPATAKHKGSGIPGSQFEGSGGQYAKAEQQNQAVTIALPIPSQTASVSAPIAATPSSLSLNSNGGTTSTSGSSLGGSNSSTSLSSTSNGSMTSAFASATSSDEALNMQHNALAQLAKQYGGDPNNLLSPGPGLSSSFYDAQQLRQTIQAQQNDPAPRFQVTEETWRHSAQARHVLGNLIGPNGEQLTSNDPYNTTVFVGGLSPLISEETLRTFFAPFGEIHYVKVPIGKHCGFVQFVRKSDAERAIEKMQGFPIGGSKIRLSWGRSQYKAAQAAAQAAQATLQQSQYAAGQFGSMTQQQAMQLLEKFAMQNYQADNGMSSIPEGGEPDTNLNYAAMLASGAVSLGMPREDIGPSYDYSGFIPRPEVQRALTSFSPFSPDPNQSIPDCKRRESIHAPRLDTLPHPSKAYAPGFIPLQPQDVKGGTSPNRLSPTSSRPSSASRYGFADLTDPPAHLNRAPGRGEAPISRPSSGQTASPQDAGRLDLDPMHDLNHTLANLDLLSHSSSQSGQFHLTTNA